MWGRLVTGPNDRGKLTTCPTTAGPGPPVGPVGNRPGRPWPVTNRPHRDSADSGDSLQRAGRLAPAGGVGETQTNQPAPQVRLSRPTCGRVHFQFSSTTAGSAGLAAESITSLLVGSFLTFFWSSRNSSTGSTSSNTRVP